jgi:hypothetical protein
MKEFLQVKKPQPHRFIKSVGRIEQSEIRRNNSSAEGKSCNSDGREQKE